MNSRGSCIFRIAFGLWAVLSVSAMATLVACDGGPAAPETALGPRWAEDTHRAEPGGCKDGVEERGLALVNVVRARAKAGPFGCLEKLSAMAAAHAGFLASNEGTKRSSSHREESGAPGYSGSTLGERAEAQGLDTSHYWLSEGVGGGADPRAVIRAHLGTVYHRSALLAPGGKYFSLAIGQGEMAHAVMNMLLWVTVDGLEPARWPAPGEGAAPVEFNPTGEIPDPAPEFVRPGYPVSVHFPRYLDEQGHEPALSVDEFALALEDGAAVPAKLLHRAVDPRVFGSDAFLVPSAPLLPGRRYRVTAKMRYGAFELDESWTFRTTSEGS